MMWIRRLFIEVGGDTEEDCVESLNKIIDFAHELFETDIRIQTIGTYRLEYTQKIRCEDYHGEET